jgi:hypothetical protein
MNKNRKIYNPYQLIAAVFMIVALIWLTISTPFVYSSQQKKAEKDQLENNRSFNTQAGDEDTTNPFGNNTEEKSSTGTSSLSEEYLHDHCITGHFFTILTHYPKCKDAGTYIAFHGELLVPPPNIA